ncbi:MAG: dihydroxyacetone kinase subunit DhaK [Firmicutes bacterium]|nr:dihydroxyacetone kinase subunit DhaK [Bacillota bacterium]
MKKLINDPYKVVDEMLAGFVKAHPNYVRMVHPRGLVRKAPPKKGKVGLMIGGGSGHKPAFIGYIGEGVADGVAVGNVFASPPPEPALEVTKAIDTGAGVLYSYGNYQGDILNFNMAAELAAMEGIRVETVLVTDDIASAPKDQMEKRRGIAGDFFVFKIAGAMAETMASLDEVKRVAEKANFNTRTMGVALSGCTVPAAGKPIFTLGENEMEIGLGIHGEPGVRRGKLETADEVATDITERIIADLPFQSGDEVAVLVNGLGATPYMELYIVYRKVAEILADHGISIYRSYVGEYVTSLEMAGCSVTLMRLDDELKRLLDAPADTPFFVQK